MRAGWAILIAAAVGCGDAADDVREGFNDSFDPGTASDTPRTSDSLIDQVPYFPADGESPDAPSSSTGGNTGAAGQGSSTTQPSAPAGPAGSAPREGRPPAGGDDLGGRRDVGASSATSDILNRAARAYAGVRTLRADFEQSTENPVLRRTTTSRGTLFQSRPDRFAMRFSEPNGDRIVADGEYIWVYYPSVDADQVIRMRAGAGGAGAVDLQAQFLGDPTTRFDAVHNGTESVGGRAADVLTLTPRDDASFRTLKVWVDRDDALVRRFEITEHNGVVRRFLLRNLSPGASIEASVFRFTPPDGAHVVARG